MKQVFTLANIITLSRLVLCIPIFYLLWTEGPTSTVTALFAVAAASDMFDGYAARKRNEVSSLGKLLDPVADKILVVGTLIAFAARRIIPLAWLIMLAAKELAMLLGGLILLRNKQRIIAARLSGKVATVVLLAGIIGVLVGLDEVGSALIGVGTLLSLIAGLDYLTFILRNDQSQADNTRVG